MKSYKFYFQITFSVVLVSLLTILGGCGKENLQSAEKEVPAGEGQWVPMVVHLDAASSSVLMASDSVLIAVYKDDRQRFLDSFCKFSPSASSFYQTMCTPGKRVVVAISGYLASELDLEDMLSYDVLMQRIVDLRCEEALSPVCVGVVNVSVTDFAELRLMLEPVMSRIVVRNLKFDFIGKPCYGISVLHNLKCYLINVNTLSPLMPSASISPCEWINQGKLNENDMGDFSSPDMLFAHFARNIAVGEDLPVNKSFYAYPNPLYDFGGKMKFATMLVFQCEVDGREYFWPVEINTGDFQGECQGIGRNRTYVYDITITGLGAAQISGSVSPNILKIENVTNEWFEEEEETVLFSKKCSNVVFSFVNPDESGDVEIPDAGERASSGSFHDVNLFVFNENGVLEEKRYVEHGTGGLTVRLYNNCRYSFYCVANAGYSIKATCKEDVLNYLYPLSTPGEQVFGMPYSAAVEDFLVNANNHLTLPFERLFAKVNVRLDRSRLDGDVKMYVKSAKMCNVAKKTYAFAPNTVKTYNDTFLQGYYFSNEEVGVLNTNLGAKTDPLEFYLLENISGKTLWDDNRDMCAYLELKLSYSSGEAYTPDGSYVVYRSYIHDGNKSLDIVRNHVYNITIAPTGNGLTRHRDDAWMLDKSAIVYYE